MTFTFDANMETANEWIPVSERLPKSGMLEDGNVIKYVLIQDEYGDIRLAHYDEEFAKLNGWYMVDHAFNDKPINVVAWMPLPETYKAGDTE